MESLQGWEWTWRRQPHHHSASSWASISLGTPRHDSITLAAEDFLVDGCWSGGKCSALVYDFSVLLPKEGD